jgi:rubrerythrin
MARYYRRLGRLKTDFGAECQAKTGVLWYELQTFCAAIPRQNTNPVEGAIMTIEEAIKTAIAYEKKVHTSYVDAARRAKDETAQKVFRTMAQEEMGHITYLESRLGEWQRTGQLSPEKLLTVFPSADRLQEGLARLRSRVAQRKGSHPSELESLRQALAAEDETSGFYRQMVLELPAQGQELFSRFLEIEEGHAAIVQAEIDSVNRMGFWFDLEEFDLESG